MGKVKNVKRIAIGAAVAGAAGYLAGVLTAPSSGKKMRKELKKTAGTSMDEVEKELNNLQVELSDLVQEAKNRSDDLGGRAQKKFGHALEGAHASKNKLRDVLSAVHKGQADDKDLDRALADAKRALYHLKDFIKK
jgi:gas vesicle protein